MELLSYVIPYGYSSMENPFADISAFSDSGSAFSNSSKKSACDNNDWHLNNSLMAAFSASWAERTSSASSARIFSFFFSAEMLCLCAFATASNFLRNSAGTFRAVVNSVSPLSTRINSPSSVMYRFPDILTASFLLSFNLMIFAILYGSFLFYFSMYFCIGNMRNMERDETGNAPMA